MTKLNIPSRLFLKRFASQRHEYFEIEPFKVDLVLDFPKVKSLTPYQQKKLQEIAAKRKKQSDEVTGE